MAKRITTLISPGGSSTPSAPGITATCAIGLVNIGTKNLAVFSGNITLPGALGTMGELLTEAISPAGSAIQLGTVPSAAIAAAGPGGVIPYSNSSSQIVQTTSAQPGWSLKVTPFNTSGDAGAPYTVSGLTIPAATITSISASDDVAARWPDPALHAVVPVVLACANYPQPVTLWSQYATSLGAGYGRKMQGWFLMSGPTTIYLGAKPGTSLAATGVPTSLFPPISAAENVTIYAAIGYYDDTVDPTTVVGEVSSTFSMAAPAAPSTTAVSGAYVDVLTYAQAMFGWAHWYMTLPYYSPTAGTGDPNFFYARIYARTGHYSGATFVRGGWLNQAGDVDGWHNLASWTTPGDPGNGRDMSLVSVSGSTQSIVDVNPNYWPIPADGNLTVQLMVASASRLNTTDWRGGPPQNANEVVQNCWISSGCGVPKTTADGYYVYEFTVDPTRGQTQGNWITPASTSNVGTNPNTGTFGVPNTNFGLSLISDPGFEYSAPGYLIGGTPLGQTQFWTVSGTIQIKNDGGSSGSNYARLTGPSTLLSRPVFAVNPGVVIYCSAAARSSNTAGSHSLTLALLFFDASGAGIGGPVVINTASGYLSAWTATAITGTVTPPSNAATAAVYLYTNPSEPGGGYWDVDDVNLQPVIQQTVGTQQLQTTQGTLTSGQGGYVAQNTSTPGVGTYGQAAWQLAGSAVGNFIGASLQSGSFNTLEIVSDGTTYASQLIIGSGSNQITFQVGGGIVIFLSAAGVSHVAYTGSLSSAVSAGKQVIAGMIVN